MELPGWLFQGERPAPEVEAAEAVVAAEQEAAPAAQPEELVQQAEEPAAPQQSQQAEAAVEQPQPVADAAEVEPAAEQEQEAHQAAAADAGALAGEFSWWFGGSASIWPAAAVHKMPPSCHLMCTAAHAHPLLPLPCHAAPAEEAAEAASEGEQEEEEEEESEDFCHICGQSDEGDILLLCDSCGEQAGLENVGSLEQMLSMVPTTCVRAFSSMPTALGALPSNPAPVLLSMPAPSLNPCADNACHLSCCNPPLKCVPKGDWFCVECVARQQAEAAAAAAAKAK